ncbi:hypothetical protein ARMSODRAFT_1090359 [Armillaria solidipes]|uniref:C2H2-type domain-containing protein n=1 Tax=Armillaria solidipes TaxID=1076256 RepID=A0A2H3AUV5_9AGAR|nr:hypothetical protein ARMSODRAFT_1090359 [Armillaria solidipes]
MSNNPNVAFDFDPSSSLRKDQSGFMQSDQTCVHCLQECSEDVCAQRSLEMTSQCTDQCVVVTCNDLTHGSASVTCDESDHCDFICDGATNCPDCSGLDEFLQCCTDFHSYFSDPKAQHQANWDPTFDGLCNCNETPRNAFSSGSSSSSASPSPFVDMQPPPNFPSHNSSTSPESGTSSFMDLTSGQPPPLPPLSCMWGDCHARFHAMEQLVEHVNLEHLSLSSPIPPTAPCQWGDCHEQLSQQPELSLDVLANHLFQDHLMWPASMEPVASSSSSPLTPTSAPVDFGLLTPLPPPATSDHKCSETQHICHWQGCGKSFSTCDDLTVHLASEHVGSGKAHYDCYWNDCARHGEQGFSSKQKICRHLQSHTGHRPFQCKICHQNFSEAATLQQHMRRHTQEKPYSCDHPGCGKSFAIAGALTIHKRTHNGHKPFKCTYCDRAFTESSNLSKHLRTHTGARPYPCTEPGCNKCFARPDQLTRHMSVHRKKQVER